VQRCLAGVVLLLIALCPRVGFGQVTSSTIEAAPAASRVFGRGSAAGAGAWEPLTVGGGLQVVGTVLTNAGLSTVYIPAGGLEVSGACALNAGAALVTNGPKVTTISCTAANTDGVEFDLLMPDGWDAGTITIELDVFYTGTTHNGQTFDMNFSGQCVSTGDVVAAYAITSGTTNESASNVEAVVTANATANRELQATTAALTLAGSCAVGDHIYVHGLVDASSTSFTPMSELKILGLKVEWTRSAND
jgi:hypothetical protein